MKTKIDDGLISPTKKRNPDDGEIIPRTQPKPVEPGKKIPLND